MKKSNKSATFLELMITSLVILIAVLALLQAYISSINLVIRAREMDIATDDSKDVLEVIRCTAFSNIPTTFPDNSHINASVVGGFVLNNEDIVVRYYDASGNDVNVTASNIPDPLLIEVVVSWTGRDRRNYTQSFRTLRTRGI